MDEERQNTLGSNHATDTGDGCHLRRSYFSSPFPTEPTPSFTPNTPTRPKTKVISFVSVDLSSRVPPTTEKSQWADHRLDSEPGY